MSYRGRSRNNYDRRGGNSYRGSSNNYSQHDNRDRDNESGEFYNRRDQQNGRYEPRGRGGGKYRGSGPGGRSRGRRGGYRGGRSSSYRGGRGSSSNSGYVDPDGDIDMEGGGSNRGRPRHSPYARPKQDNQRYRGITKHIANNVDNRPSRWNLITVLQGGFLDRDWLMEAIQKEAMVQIRPVQYFHDGENASFCIEDNEVAQSVRDCDRKIVAPDGSKLVILKAYCSPPLKDEQFPILKEVLSSRYNTKDLHLDASALFIDKTLRSNKIEIKPKFAKDMYILINIIGEHLSGLISLDLSDNRMDRLSHLKNLVVVTPRLKRLKLAKNDLRNEKELDNIKEWDLAELNLDGNPLCQHFNQQSDYISSMRDKFQNLEILDGKKLPPPVKFDLEKETKLVPAIPNHIPPQVTEIIKQFVKQYFALYDTSRDGLSPAYADNCLFSLTIPSTPRGPPLSKYFQNSRNLQRMKSQKNKLTTLKKSKSEINATFKELPGTEHDVAGFFVDVPFVSPTLVKFAIRGVFKEKATGKEKTQMRAFTRAFLCLTDGSKLSIINEELYIRNTTSSESRTAFAKPPVTPSPSPVPEQLASTLPSSSAQVPTATPTKSDMVQAFCKESGMNANFSEQCLNENGWDYAKAGQAFLTLKAQNKIPPEAFVQH